MLSLRQRPEQRLDLSPLVPHLLARKTAAEIERIELQTTKQRVSVGDAFRLKFGDANQIRVEGACDRLDRVGEELSDGEIRVETVERGWNVLVDLDRDDADQQQDGHRAEQPPERARVPHGNDKVSGW